MPCLSSNPDSVFNDSIRVSNAESQLALPLTMTTVFGSSVICSPKGSAVCTGAAAGGVGLCAAEGTSAGDLVSAGGGAGVAAGAADGAGARGAGVPTTGGAPARALARRWPGPHQISATRIHTATAKT